MSTTPTTIGANPIIDGTTGSSSQVLGLFNDLNSQGQTSIDQLVVVRENTLILFSNAMEELNGKRIRVNRLPEVGIAVKFVTTDLQDINQTITTGSVRADSNSFSLRERAAPGEAIVNTVRFSASEGTIQALQIPQIGSSGNLGALYRVATPDGSVPIGTFDIQLLNPVSLSLIIFDIMNTPSNAQVVASVSTNGVNYVPAQSITRNGYRLAAWFQPLESQYIKIAITPALPDTLGGSLFTFGLTDLHAFSVQYHLRSDVYTNQIEFTPRSANLQFVTLTVPGLLYFLSLAGNPPVEVFPGDEIPIPGTAEISQTSIGLIAPIGVSWQAGHIYSLNDQIIDSNGNLQTVTTAGTSAVIEPGTVDTLSAAGNASVGNTAYTGSFTPPLTSGSPAIITGFMNAGNNGTFTIVSCNSTTLVVLNPNGVAETNPATVIFNPWSVVGGPTIDNLSDSEVVWTETVWAPLNLTLPSNTYLSTLVITDHATGIAIRTAPGLPKTSLGLTNQYFVINNDWTVDLVIYNHAVDQTRTFDVSYVTGPAFVTASLQVELTTSDLNISPIYSGAELLEV